MLIPKKTKHRKDHKRKRGGVATRNLSVSFGSYGLKAITPHWLSSRQIESARRVIAKYIKKNGKLWIRIFPDKPVTNHGGEMPMGKGKGAVDYYVAIVKPGTVIFEVEGLDEKTAKEALELAAHKLPLKAKFVVKN